AKVATAGDASEEQTAKLAELSRERDAIQALLDDATTQGKEGAEEVERLKASLADEQAT
ncbi:hypothetical protein T484DRAFT_1774753, partial [Baffinella frigidus]